VSTRTLTDFDRTPLGKVCRWYDRVTAGLVRHPGMSDQEWHRRVLRRMRRALKEEETNERD